MFPANVDVAAVWAAVEAAAEQAGLAIYAARIDVSPAQTVYISPNSIRITGRSREQLIGHPPWVILAPSEIARIQQLLAPPVSPGHTQSIDILVERPDGTQFPANLGTTRIATADGVFSIGYLRDLSTEREAIAALSQSEQRFRKLVEAAPDGVVIVRGEPNEIVFINARGAHLLGNAPIANVQGHSLANFVPTEDYKTVRARIARLLATGVETPPTEYGIRVDPERVIEIKAIVIEWDGAPAVLGFARDVTDRKRLQNRLVETDRLAALGTLSAGVAHEINNPLTYATLGLQRIERAIGTLGVTDDRLAPIRAQLREVEHGLSRVATITRGLRSFARPDDTPPGPVNLIEVIESSLRMVDNDLRHRATLLRSLSRVPLVTGNASRLEQIVVNLLLNAIQALPLDRTNVIEVTAAPSPPDRVTLAIRDTGRGIPAPIRDRIFEPFFTTRAVGDGMGLGLSVCRTIVEAFGGTIHIARSDEHGTTMVVTLRVHTGPVEPPSPDSPTNYDDTQRSPRTDTSRKRVLIVDDEPILRDTLTRVLSGDHDITTACSGPDALRKLEALRYDAILCDVMMPGMSGVEVYRRVAAAYPGLERRIVFITGGTFSSELDDLVATTKNRMLTKPFHLDDVIEAVDRVANEE